MATPAAAPELAPDGVPVSAAVAPPAPTEDGGVPDARLITVAPATYPDVQPASPPATTVIPPATPLGNAPTAQMQNDIAAYLSQGQGPAQLGPPMQPPPFPATAFLTDDYLPMGLRLREARRKLKAGNAVDGLLIVDVKAGSPAAKAGLHSSHEYVSEFLDAAAVGGAMAFPPAMLALPILLPTISAARLFESYDMIIGVDGSPVSNIIDFRDHMLQCEPGEIVYLSVVRNGRRLQVSVNLPKGQPLEY